MTAAESRQRESGQENADGPSSEMSSEQAFFPDAELISVALEAGRIGIWSWDISTKRATWSSNIEAVCGLPKGSLDVTKTILEDDVHPEDRPSVVAAMQEALRTHTPRRVQYRLLTKAGAEERWIETLATVVLDGGVPTKLLGICRDVTDRARMHRELRIRASQQEAVARIGAQALTELGLQRFFDESVKTIAATLDVELVKILELVPGDAELLLRAGTGWTRDWSAPRWCRPTATRRPASRSRPAAR